MTKLGFIGIGNMGEVILRGVLQNLLLPPEHVYIYDTNIARVKSMQEQYGVLTAQSSSAMIAPCDMVLLAVKPNICGTVLSECAKALAGKALISVVTGWSKQDIAEIAPEARILRVMPNTPCMVNEGMIALDMDHTLQAEEFAFAEKLLGATGRVAQVSSSLMPGVTGISGSGPAYVYLFMEALADGGVRAGLPRDLAYQLAAQTVIGAGKMLQKTGMHPGALKDAVCSPGGTTIEAVAALERSGFRAAVLDAVEACIDKAAAMENSK